MSGMNGSAMNGTLSAEARTQTDLIELTLRLKNANLVKFHGDSLIGDRIRDSGFVANLLKGLDDLKRVLTFKNLPTVLKVAGKAALGGGLDLKAGASLIASLSNDSNRRAALIKAQVKAKYDRMLHPPLTYLGGAFQYRSADGKFNNVLVPHLGQAGAPYAKSVPSVTHPLGALPDPGDIFDRLMAREEGGRVSKSGLSSMLIYHATIIIHDIFRTNDGDKNISDSSSYLDLSPLYGYNMEMQRAVRDDKYKLGLLKPDTFAEDRLLRQPPGVCIMLVMYNRYHNYVATQLRRINENGRFSVPSKFNGPEISAAAKYFIKPEKQDEVFRKLCSDFRKAWDVWNSKGQARQGKRDENYQSYNTLSIRLEKLIQEAQVSEEARARFTAEYNAAWDKLDDDLFNTARLVTCGMYIQISIHDYLRALMGFHQWNTNFTLEPRAADTHNNVSRGLGNQVTVEFNLLYRFHCAISVNDEAYTEEFFKQLYQGAYGEAAAPDWDPKSLKIEDYLDITKKIAEIQKRKDLKEEQETGQPITGPRPWLKEFGLPNEKSTGHFKRDNITGLFDDEAMVRALTKAMDDPISNFGPRNIPRCMKAVEIMGIKQARKWEIGTLNDFREFFGMKRHKTFEDVSGNEEIQDALRDLYEHPDKVELYPGVFCESDKDMGVDPGPSDVSSALWAAIFSDAITLVRSDRFYTVDWNTNSLTSWGMKEVTPDNDIFKSSMFHRLVQRAFPEWYPFNSIRFFHPFYTGQTNAKFAQEQGYGPEFRMKQKDSKGKVEFDFAASEARKPWKPVYLTNPKAIKQVLLDKEDYFVHPAWSELSNLPKPMVDILKPNQAKSHGATGVKIRYDRKQMERYFVTLIRDIVRREAVLMDKKQGKFSIDITRDLAIPVTTRYVSDFLGIGHHIRCTLNPKGKYSENELYQHITNVQVYLSYNADETKMMKRRQAFKASMKFLFGLAKNGNALEASRTAIGRFFLGRRIPEGDVMTKLGLDTAAEILKHEGDSGKTAAILLLTALDIAYDCVLSFSAILEALLEDMYKSLEPENETKVDSLQSWRKIQETAFREDEESIKTITKIVMDYQQKSVQLPIIRKATKDKEIRFDGEVIRISKDYIVICDQHGSEDAEITSSSKLEDDFIKHTSNFTQKYSRYRPHGIADLSLTSMIIAVAQMRNLRRGHDTQGRLKKVTVDESSEGYANYMAPMRIKRIAEQAKEQKRTDIYDPSVLRPETVTYLTPEWDEMVPFPNTWKLRFDGFGESTYGGKNLNMLQPSVLPDDIPPFYQKRGPSDVGGTLADVACICNTPGLPCSCKAAAHGEKPEVRVGDDVNRRPYKPSRQVNILAGCGISSESGYRHY